VNKGIAADHSMVHVARVTGGERRVDARPGLQFGYQLSPVLSAAVS
jgi:hypothetical protein